MLMSEIRAWLGGLGLGQYVEAFEAEQIEMADLRDLEDADLGKLGLPMGPRKRLLRAIAALAAEPEPQADAAAAPPSPKYAPAALAEKILSSRSGVEGERKQVTILFADVKGSTDLVQHLDAEAVSALLDPLQKTMIDAVHAYEGTVNEVLGDGIMAIFGAPIAHEDHALRACRAALDMQSALHRLVEQSEPQSPLHSIRLRVGLNSGEVVVRAINNDLTISYSAMGMTTHLAARMEQSAEPGTILISNDTHRLVSGLVDACRRGEITVKGVAKPVQPFELRGLGKARTRLEAATIGGLTRFVGRAHELRVLEERFAEAEAGQGQVVSIVGDPGIGKSRLLMEFRTHLGNRASWAEGHSVSFGQSMAFHPLVGLLRRNFRIEEHDAADTVREKVAAAVGRIGPGLEPALPPLFYLLGVAPADDPVQRLDPQIRRAETFEALRQLLLRAAERKPQVLVFEDLHWSDVATREFLTYLLDSIPRARALILLTLRPGHDVALGERTYATHLVLSTLSAAESEAMAAAALASADLPPDLHALVRRKAEGNPFFVEELIKSLSETGAIHRDGERWVLGRPLDQIVVPDTIQDVLMARIDRLEDEPRQALQLAAVIGREFTQRLLDRIAEIRAGTTTVLRQLQAIELIYEKALFPELAYMFKHALTQDVAYGSLLTQRRRELHRRIGEAIEELYADRLAEHYAVLGYHFAQAEDWRRAATYFENAADQAAASFAIHEAVALCDQAIEALDRGESADSAERQGDLHAKKAALLMLVSDFERAHAEHEQTATIARQLSDAVRQGSALAGMAFASARAHKFERSLDESGRAIKIGRAVGFAEIVAAGQYTTGVVHAVTGHLAEGRNDLEQAYELSRAEGNAFYEALSSGVLGFIDNWRGDYGRAAGKAKKAVDFARTHNRSFALLLGLFYFGLPLAGRGHYDQAFATFSDGLELAEKLGDKIFRNRFLNCLGWVFAECGDLERAIEFNERGVGASRQRGDPETIANAELNLGDLWLTKGDLGLARDFFERVHGLARRPSTSDWMKWRYSQHLFVSLGEVWLASDDPARAEDFCHQCLELATRTESKKYLVRGWRLKAEIAVARRQWEEAEAALRKSLTYAKRVRNPTQLWKTQLALGQFYRDTRRIGAARSSFAAARKVIEGMGESLKTPELKEGFDRSPLIRVAYEQAEVS
jgi:class 3 adenylate cyclase/tetratricopeptide (TPR) repeat protein